jgi:uncharacterized integral membrane protein
MNVWVVRGIVFLLLLFVLVYLFLDNSNQTVDIKLFKRSYLDISIFWVVVVSYLLGFTSCFVWALTRWVRHLRKVSRLKSDLQAKEREIADLRQLPLQDLPDESSGEASDRE